MEQNAFNPKTGAVRVNKTPCGSCPFDPNRAVDFLPPDEVAELMEASRNSEFQPNVCHSSVWGMHGIRGGASVCRGFIDACPDHTFSRAVKTGLVKIELVDVPNAIPDDDESNTSKKKCHDCGATYDRGAPHEMFCEAKTCTVCLNTSNEILDVNDDGERVCEECT